ncbi:regulator of chromosome condensation 1/beta-lactamase-inhibitor protein II [Gymnopilus junonius]|uniref:Regulator of chromosome condensation 1/beta-lactamase-inhibitor protein II n=1 Tax=Gymnopilus junonius TaxID=109634 RepID=A0A9P5P440_GYMJU|nr:regulator of chromosome condensation 1/beta-lactamase-inhibitor protein II [Gymnopilus junonius]
MAPRRSSRAPSTKPASKPAAESAAPKPINGSKRAASPERKEAPPSKRSRSVAPKSENEPPVKPPSRKPRSKTAAAKAAAEPAPKKARKLSPIREAQPAPSTQQLKLYFNPLPTPPKKQRPGLLPFAWGTGNFGQFGMGPDVLDELPKPKRNLWAEAEMEKNSFGENKAGMEFVASGGLHTIFIDEKGTVWTCGVNDDAALGRITQNVPDPNNPGSFLSVDDLTAIPHPLPTLIDEGFRAVKAVAGDSICAAVSDKGELRVWGSFRANEGSLGFSTGLQHQYTPVPILELSHKPGDIEKVSSIAAGSNHLLVLTTHGHIYSWGAGEQAQLGRKVLERRKMNGTVPEKVTLGTRGRKAVTVGAGAFHSFAVDDNGDVWGWGLNSMGQTGTGFSSSEDSVVQLPQKVKNLSKEELGADIVVQVAGGTHHTLFLLQSGKVYATGRSSAGQLGLPEDHPAFKDRADDEFVPEPVLVPFPDPNDPIVGISCGPHNSAAVTRGGALYAWGQGVQGELGLGDVEEAKIPQVVVRKDGGAWFAAAVSCGGQHTVGLFRKKN